MSTVYDPPDPFAVDWSQAPDGADWHTFDRDGTCYWWWNEPTPNGEDGYWWHPGNVRWHASLGVICWTWDSSLRRRPPAAERVDKPGESE